MAKLSLFASYSRQDTDTAVVLQVVDALKEAGVDVWIDLHDLQPGSSWDVEIQKALRLANGLLVFISPSYQDSAFAKKELEEMMAREGLVIPVVFDPSDTRYVPKPLSTRLLVLGRHPTPEDIRDAAVMIAEAATYFAKPPRREALLEEPVLEAARALASDRREAVAPSTAGPPTSVFLVHGHDEEFLNEVTDFLGALGIESVVLARTGGAAQSLFQKFLQFGTETRFAIVLLTGDDFGAALKQYEAPNVGDRALQFRPRQNVILELGFFYGHLGWENVFVLRKDPDRVFPNFELPSDLEGVVFDHVDSSGVWRELLRKRLDEGGFEAMEK